MANSTKRILQMMKPNTYLDDILSDISRSLEVSDNAMASKPAFVIPPPIPSPSMAELLAQCLAPSTAKDKLPK